MTEGSEPDTSFGEVRGTTDVPIPRSRLEWDDVWSLVARIIARRSACVRRQVGAVIVDVTERVVATGYNGPPAGYRHTCRTGCPRATEKPQASYDNCVAIHAEANALLFCDRRERLSGTIYTTLLPCFWCAKLIANSGLTRVVALDIEDHLDPIHVTSFLEVSDVEVILR